MRRIGYGIASVSSLVGGFTSLVGIQKVGVIVLAVLVAGLAVSNAWSYSAYGSLNTDYQDYISTHSYNNTEYDALKAQYDALNQTRKKLGATMPPASTPQFTAKWPEFPPESSLNGYFNYPLDVAVDSSGNVYVTDIWNHRVQKFTSDGEFITKWGSGGSGDGEFATPYGVALDSSGNIYVVDGRNQRIQKFH